MLQKKVVFIGGGGGGSRIVPPLRDKYDVTAIMMTFDNGGSTGRLREAFKTVAVGDLRRAFAALSTNEWRDKLNYRFEKGDIKGHTLGNLILTEALLNNKSPQAAIEQLHHLFAIKGRVIGASYDDCQLVAELEDGTIIQGEHAIDEPRSTSDIPIKKVWLNSSAVPAAGVVNAIRQADLIFLGHGDLYTSLIPILLIPGIAEAIKTSQAKRVYVCIDFTKYGQTNNFTVSDHLAVVEKYLGGKYVDRVVANTSKISSEVVKSQAEYHETPVKLDIEKLEEAGYDVLCRDLLKKQIIQKSSADILKRSKIGLDADKVISLVKELI